MCGQFNLAPSFKPSHPHLLNEEAPASLVDLYNKLACLLPSFVSSALLSWRCLFLCFCYSLLTLFSCAYYPCFLSSSFCGLLLRPLANKRVSQQAPQHTLTRLSGKHAQRDPERPVSGRSVHLPGVTGPVLGRWLLAALEETGPIGPCSVTCTSMAVQIDRTVAKCT